MERNDTKILEKTSETISQFYDGALEMDMGYKFRTREFLNVAFLYKNSVDVKNPDLLGVNNRNTFVFEPASQIAKIKEQVRMDIKDINFIINGASSLATFIPKAANRKILEDNAFDVTIDQIPDDAVDYGSGFLKVWEVGKELKMKSIDPFNMIFNQYNFRDSIKVEKFTKTYRWILDNDKYDEDKRDDLRNKIDEVTYDDFTTLYQTVQDYPDGTQEINIVSTDEELVFYHATSKKIAVSYYKFDYEKRRGFEDALGVGCIERVFNKIVQSKVNRDRMDKVMEIASKLPFQKQIDNERDNLVGQDVVKLDTGVILGHKGNVIQPLDTGGVKQANLIRAELDIIHATIGNDLNVGEALQGNTLPSGTSGVLGNLLTENASSVLKEVTKDYAKFLGRVYKDRLIKFILGAFNSDDDLRKYLDPNDIKLVELSVINYLKIQKQVNAAINDIPYNEAGATEEAKREIKRGKLISGKLLESLREEMKGIRTFITAEQVSKAQTVAFIRELRETIAQNPALLTDPRFVTLLKKEAEFDSGLSGVEIDNLLREMPQVQQQEQPLEATAQQ